MGFDEALVRAFGKDVEAEVEAAAKEAAAQEDEGVSSAQTVPSTESVISIGKGVVLVFLSAMFAIAAVAEFLYFYLQSVQLRAVDSAFDEAADFSRMTAWAALVIGGILAWILGAAAERPFRVAREKGVPHNR